MTEWLKRIRGAMGIALVWGAVWAAVGALNAVVAPAALDGLWVGPPIGVFPGVVGGLLFSALLAIAAYGRRLYELSLAEVGAFGGLVGLFLGVMPLAINKPPEQYPVWMVAGVVIGSLTLMGAVSGAGSLALARKAQRLPAASAS